MDLDKRIVCFACQAPSFREIWGNEESVLHQCRSCRAEWLEGRTPGEPGYRYEDFDRTEVLRSEARARRFAGYLEQTAVTGRVLLDVGCGTGAFMRFASRMGWDPVGVG